jgi:hypothetical protein
MCFGAEWVSYTKGAESAVWSSLCSVRLVARWISIGADQRRHAGPSARRNFTDFPLGRIELRKCTLKR